jgi:hydrogenase maturation protease
MDESTALLILGLGNVLCGDDGLGAAAVTRLLRHYRIPEGIRVIDGGTLGLSLLPYLQDAHEVILVDAVRADAPPGTCVRLEGEEVRTAVLHRLSPHQVGVADLLFAARALDHYPGRLIILGLVPDTLDLGLGRSPAVQRNLPLLVDRIVAEACSLGHPLVPAKPHEVDLPEGAGDVARVLGL